MLLSCQRGLWGSGLISAVGLHFERYNVKPRFVTNTILYLGKMYVKIYAPGKTQVSEGSTINAFVLTKAISIHL